jgi:hypothetical protein
MRGEEYIVCIDLEILPQYDVCISWGRCVYFSIASVGDFLDRSGCDLLHDSDLFEAPLPDMPFH